VLGLFSMMYFPDSMTWLRLGVWPLIGLGIYLF